MTAEERCANCGWSRAEHDDPNEFVARPAIDVRTAGSDGHWDHADIQRLCEYRDRLRAALEMLYDKWEDGNDCYEDPEDCSGYLGKAFRLSEADEKEVLALIPEQHSPRPEDDVTPPQEAK